MLDNIQEVQANPEEVVEEEVLEEEVLDAVMPTIEDMEEVALSAVGRISIQDLIDDSVRALVEVYKARPESYYFDARHYDDSNKNSPSPFLDLIQYLREVNPDSYSQDIDDASDRDTAV
ncbi:hypothetical protein CL634_03600 [bacterium]|nr:hypothetical protein [bacterium]|tara:strand:- start:909 stop:1265 length:357 start_codon:yes stop_codon:yes gene_type:complete